MSIEVTGFYCVTESENTLCGKMQNFLTSKQVVHTHSHICYFKTLSAANIIYSRWQRYECGSLMKW